MHGAMNMHDFLEFNGKKSFFSSLSPSDAFWWGFDVVLYLTKNKWRIATPTSIQARCSSKSLWFWRGIERKERARKIYSVYTLKNLWLSDSEWAEIS